MLPTRCDFCGRPFDAVSWGQRTCVACAAKGAPDQGSLDWATYVPLLRAYAKKIAAGRPSGAKLAPQATKPSTNRLEGKNAKVVAGRL